MAADDALDSALIQFKQEKDDQTTIAATASMHQAITQNPDEMARYNSIARKTGFDPLMIATDPQVKVEAERQARMADVNLPDLVQTHPKTASALTDANLAALAHDDVSAMQSLEDALGFFKRSGSAILSAVPQAASGVWGVTRAASDVFLRPYTKLAAEVTGAPDIGGVISEHAKVAQERLDAEAKALMPVGEGVLESGYYSGLQSLGISALTLPIAVAGAPAAALGAMSAVTGGVAYGEAVNKGVSPATAFMFGLSQAGVEFWTEKIPMSALLKDLKIGSPLYKTLAHQVAREVPGEQVATLVQDLNEWAVLHPEKPFADYVAERPSAAAQTLIATLVGTGGVIATAKGLEYLTKGDMDQKKAQWSEERHQALSEISQTAAALKLRERDQVRFKEFMQAMVEDSDLKEVWIDGTKLRDVLAQAPVEVQQKFAQDMPGVIEQITEATNIDGLVRVPLEDYATHIAGTELDAAILPNLKTDVAGMTYAEVQEGAKTQTAEMTAEAEKIIAEKEQDKEFQADAQGVYDTLLSRIEGAKRFSPDANKKYAALQQAYFITRAKKLGIKPSELLARFNIKVQAERTGAAAEMEQRPQIETPEFKKWFGGSKVVDAEGKPMVVYHGARPGVEIVDFRARHETDGIYFTPDVTYAESFTEGLFGAKGAGAVYSVYLNIQNPYVVEAEFGSPEWINFVDRGINRLELKNRGYDGAILKEKGGEVDQIIAFEPTQIKSAIGNIGTFDPNDPNILRQTRITGTGRGFTAFFTAATQGERAPDDTIPYRPALDISKSVPKEIQVEYAKHKGSFDAHIASSIPGFLEVQQLVTKALVDTYSEKGADVLDIGASEGALIKTAAVLSKGKIRTVGVDPNEAMAKQFRAEGKIPGSEYVLAAFGEKDQEGQIAWTEESGTPIPYYAPDRLFDVVHEAMVFQFISNEREAQFRRAKEMLKPNGIALFEEKVKENTAQWRANEAKKDAYKAQFFNESQLAAKRQEVLERGAEAVKAEESAKEQATVGMNDLMPTQASLEQSLLKNFRYVSQYWDSGNFKGYVASDSEAALNTFLGNLGGTQSEFSTIETPRRIGASTEVKRSSDYGYRARERARIATLEDFTPAKIGNLLRKKDWAILTAENPNAQQLSPEENAQRNAELKADLDALGVQYVELEGKHGGNAENSFAIVGITKDQAIELGQKYGQQAVLTRDGFVGQDGTVNPAKGVKTHAEAPSDFYSRIPSTGAVFAVDIDFEKTLPASDDRAGSVTVEAVHFSREPRSALSGAKYGTGIRGAEARRLADPNTHPKIKQRISFYVDEGQGVRPEAGVGAFRHELTLTNIYDGAKNPLGLPSEPNAFEAAVIEAGFDGYYIREGFGNQGVGVLLGDASLDIKVDMPPAGAVFEQRYQTETPEFKNWFGESKVVDAEGDPLVVYHGATSLFDVFNGAEVVGWFAEKKATAEIYAKRAEEGETPQVFSVYLSIKKPLDLTARFDMNKEMTVEQVLAKVPEIKVDARRFADTEYAWQVVSDSVFMEGLKEAGYDGVKVNEKGAPTWAIVDPTQVKSATANIGTFDPTNVSILYQSLPPDADVKWRNILEAPGVDGVYPVKTMAGDIQYSLFDGGYWRGVWPSVGMAWRMREAPVVTDLTQWGDFIGALGTEENAKVLYQSLNEVAETPPPVGKLEQQDLADLRKLWAMYAQAETAAQYGTAQVKAIPGDARDMQRAFTETVDAVMLGESVNVKSITHWHEGTQRLPAGGLAYEIVSGKRSAAVYLDVASKTIQVDVTSWGEGGGGSGVYKAVLDFARANDFVFLGDAQGISVAGIKRRLENLLSHALQTGDTSYMRLHPKQIEFIEQETGLKIEWTKDSKDNVEQMLNASYNLANLDIPELKNVYFDFVQRQFIARDTGAPADLDRYVAKARRNPDAVRREGAPGLATAKRTIFANTLLSAEGENRRRVFGAMARFSLDQLPGAGRLLYQSEVGGERPAFYSALSRAVAESKQAKGTPDQWIGILKKLTQKGIKNEELEYTGVLDWLETRKDKADSWHVYEEGVVMSSRPATDPKPEGADVRLYQPSKSVTREEITDFLTENAVTVEPRVYGGEGIATEFDFSFGQWETEEPDEGYLRERAEELLDDLQDAEIAEVHGNTEEDELYARVVKALQDEPRDFGGRREFWEAHPEEARVREEILDQMTEKERDYYFNDSDSPAFSGVEVEVGDRTFNFVWIQSYGDHQLYSSDAGKDITLRSRRIDNAVIQSAIYEFLSDEYGISEVDEEEAPKFGNYKLSGGENYRERLLINKSQGEDGFSYTSHFEDDNIIAHSRVDDREVRIKNIAKDFPELAARLEAEGRDKAKIYFVEEFQSDWAQQGREKPQVRVPYKMEELSVISHFATDEITVAGYRDTEGDSYFKILRNGVPLTAGYRTREAAEEHASEIREGAARSAKIVVGATDGQEFTIKGDSLTEQGYPATSEGAMRYITQTKDYLAPGSMTAFDVSRNIARLEREMKILDDRIDALPKTGGEPTAEFNILYDQLKALREERDALPYNESVVPGAFVESTDAWVSLAIKDAIHQAASGGYDLISWTTGDQQTQRWSYGLRKQVDTIEWEKSADGKIHIIAKKGDTERANTRYGENDLSAAIGKTMAKRIIEDPNQKGEISGEGIVVADLGMTKFYGDTHGLNPDGKPAIVAKVANQVLKKLGGGQVKGVDLRASGAEGQDSMVSLQPTFEITPQMRELALQGQPLFQKHRGTFDVDAMTISLLKDADLTTFLHETGHFFLETESALASDPSAPQEVRDDFQKTLDWFGIADLATWNGMSFEQKRVYHEKFARGFEAYLLEGKAPSNELRSIFASFKAWLLHVYRTVTNLNVELTDEVRGVFDRMLASEEEIAAVQEREGMKAAMIEAADEDTKAAYVALDIGAGDDATDELQRRSLRDMKWLSNAKSEAMKKLQREAASKRKEIRAEVTTEVEAEPINQARAFLRKGTTVDLETGDSIQAVEGFRMSREIVAQMYPETMLARPDLSKLRGMTEKDGLHPDLVADMFGFLSGDALIRELIDGENPRDKITGLTDQRMLERYGDLVDENAIEAAANEAVHNDARARFMATGLKMLSDSKLPVSQIQKAAADAANATIASKKIRDLHPAKYIAAETKANREVLKKAAKDAKAAQRAQRAALLNNRLAKAAQDAQEEVRKGVDKMTRTQKAAAQANMRGEYLIQLNELLARFDLRKSTTLKEIDAKRTPLADWLAEESERLSAVMPDIPAWILNEANRRSYKELTVEEFRGVVDTIKQLEMMARREQKQYLAIRGMEFAEERKVILDRIREFHPEAFSLDGEPLGMSPKFVRHMGDKVNELGEKFVGEFLNAETLVNLLEGGEFGQVHESLLGRMSKQADWKATRIRDVYGKMAPLFGQYSVKERYDFARADIGAPIGMSLTRENALVVALLHGNKEGRERLANYGWSEQKQKDIINLLDERDMRLAQGIWDLFDTDLWPELKTLNERTRGKSPPKVEALEVEHKGVKYRGGYFRLKYDTNLDERAYRLDEGAAVKELLGGGLGMSAKTGQGASTERKQNVAMRPRLDLGVFAEAVAETVHDLAYREAVADTMRILNDTRIQNTIKTAAGVPTYRALVTRVREIAAPPRNPSGFVEKTLSVARKNTIVTLMSGVNTALQNFTGFVSAIARVNPGRLAKEIALFYSPQMAGRYDFALRQSEYMRNRHHAFERDLQNEIKKMTVNANIMPDTGAWLTLMSLVDKGTSIPVWNAAFAEGMKKFENDTSKAVDYADHVVRQTQGSGRELDVAQIMSGHGGYGQLKRIFTMFYSYFNAQLGMLVRSGLISAKAAKTNPAMATARFTKDFMLIVILPAVLTKMIFKGGGDDEDPEEWLHTYGHAIAMYGLAMIPLVRDIGSFAWASFDHDVKNYGYKITPVQSAAEGVVKGAVAARDIAIGEGDDHDLKNLILGTSYAVGLPGKLISDTTLGTKAFLEGEAPPTAVVFGPSKK